MAFDEQYSMRLDDFADLNPPRPLKKGAIAKLIDMAALPTNHRSISLASIEMRPYSSGARFKNGDSLLARITPCLENGKSAFVNCLQKDEVAAGSTEFIVIAPKREVDADFVYYASCFPEFRQHAISRMEGTSGRQRVSHHSIADFEFPCIGPEDRIAIGSMLRSLDDRIEHNRSLATNLEAIARCLFKSWFVDFDPVRAKAAGEKPAGLADDIAALFPDRFVESEIVEVPEGWNVGRLSDLVDLKYGKALKATERRDGKVPVYGSGGITGWHDVPLVEHPTVIVGRKGSVGTLYWEDRPSYPIDTTFFVTARTAPLTFCYYAMLGLGLEELNTDAAVPGLNRDNAYRQSVVIPPPDMLTAWDTIASVLRNNLGLLREESNVLTQIRDLLLPRLISGKLRVEDAETMIEEAVA